MMMGRTKPVLIVMIFVLLVMARSKLTVLLVIMLYIGSWKLLRVSVFVLMDIMCWILLLLIV